MAQNAHTRQCGQSMLGLNVDMTGNNNNNNTTKRAREQLDGAGSRGGHRGGCGSTNKCEPRVWHIHWGAEKALVETSHPQKDTEPHVRPYAKHLHPVP